MTEAGGSGRRPTLPLPLTRFIGRAEQLAEAVERITEGRLVTFVGSAGIGKTRLAVEAAHAWVDAHPADAWFIDLAPVSDAIGVDRAVGAALGLIDDSNLPPGDHVISYLRDGTALLVVDNCEQVIDDVASYIARLLGSCPSVHIVATSREPLSVAGEWLIEVPPLDLDTEAPELFDDRSRALAPASADASRAEVVRQICQQLDGVPLAIELAAARTRALSVSEIHARLGDRFVLLSTGSRTLPERHRTLAAAVDWSYQLLSAREASLYQRLGVFAGGWTLAAAEAVCSGDGIAHEEVVDVLALLVDRSLVVRDNDLEPTRYRMLESIRIHAASCLTDHDRWFRSHFEWMCATAQEAEAGIRGPQHSEWLDRLSLERENLRGALAWSATARGITAERLKLACDAVGLWRHRGPIAEGVEYLRELLAANPGQHTDESLHARIGLGILLQSAGDFPGALIELKEAALGARTAGNEAALGQALVYIGGILAIQRGGTEEAVQTLAESEPLIERAGTAHDKATFAFIASYVHPALQRDLEADLALLRTVGDGQMTGGLLNTLGELARERGDLAAARAHYRAALAARQAVPGREGSREWLCLANLAYVELMEGDTKAAIPLLKVAIRNVIDHKTLYGSSAVLVGVSLVASLTGDPALAMRLLQAAIAIDSSIGLEPNGPDVLVMRRSIELLWEALGKSTANRQIKTAPDVNVEAALVEAEDLLTRVALLHQKGEDAKIKRPGGLSRQEFEVLRFVSSGYTNREIAATLVLSVRTVENHIANAYGKIGARGRAAATSWAIANGLISVAGEVPE